MVYLQSAQRQNNWLCSKAIIPCTWNHMDVRVYRRCLLPAVLQLWFCLGIFFVSTCVRLGHMEQLSLDDAHQVGSWLQAQEHN